MFRLLDLPDELLLHTLRFLNTRDLANCLSICHTMNDTISHTLELQYKLDLSRAYLEDGTQGDLSSRHEALLSHQSSWRTLSWSEPSTFPLTDGTWELSGGVLSQNTELTDIGFKFQNLRLPSKSRGIKAKTWSFTVNIPVIDYTMDVSQDLVVIIAMRPGFPQVDQTRYDLHCLTLSTGQPHPSRSSTSPIEYDILQAGFGGQYRLQIQEHLFGLLIIGPAGTEFSVRDWKTGQVKLMVVGWSIMAFAFITDDLILLGTNTGNIQNLIPKLDIVSIKANQSDETIHRLNELVLTCALHLPTIPKHEGLDSRLTIRTDPFPSVHGKRTPAPFHTSTRDRLFVVSYGDWTRTLFDIVIPYSRLVHLAHLPRDPDARVIVWEDWGPTHTRLLDEEFMPSTTWVCYVHGMKMVVKTSEHHMAILDFRIPITEDQTLDPDPDGPVLEIKPLTGLVKFNETYHDRMVFKEDTFSSLPCTVTYFDIPGRDDDITAVMLSEDNIIILYRPLSFEKYVIYSL